MSLHNTLLLSLCPLLLYLTVHLSHSPVCLPAERCLVWNLFTINRTQIKPRLEHLTQAASFQAEFIGERGAGEERADHVFPLLTSPLWHVRTWFSLEFCFCGIAVGEATRGFFWGQVQVFHHRHPLNRALCVRFAICFPGSDEEPLRRGQGIKECVSFCACLIIKLKPEVKRSTFRQQQPR